MLMNSCSGMTKSSCSLTETAADLRFAGSRGSGEPPEALRTATPRAASREHSRNSIACDRDEVRRNDVVFGVEREIESRQVLRCRTQRRRVDGAKFREVERLHEYPAQRFGAPVLPGHRRY